MKKIKLKVKFTLSAQFQNFQTVLINQKMLDRVNEILDLTVIQQQVDQGVLNFQSYADFVINTMAVSCAPVRDEHINKLREFTDVVETFRGILEVAFRR